MKTLSEIKDEVANEYAYCSYWETVIENKGITDEHVSQIAIRYAEEVLKEVINIISYAGMNESDYQDKEQILNIIKELK